MTEAALIPFPLELVDMHSILDFNVGLFRLGGYFHHGPLQVKNHIFPYCS